MLNFGGISLYYSEFARRFGRPAQDDWVLAGLFLTIAYVSGPALAIAWLCLAVAARLHLLSEGARILQECFGPRISLAIVDIAGNATIVAFGLLFCAISPSDAAHAIAVTASFAAIAHACSKYRPQRAWIAATPPALAALVILALGAPIMAALLLSGGVGLMALTLEATRRKLDRAEMNAALSAQTLKEAAPAQSAAWELDFQTRTLKNADQLAALLGRPLSFEDVASDLLGAPTKQHDLLAAMFTPDQGPTRRVFFTHQAHSADGAIWLEHRGILHADAWGQPISLACVTLMAEAAHPALTLSEQWQMLRAHYRVADNHEVARLEGVVPPPLRQERRARA